MMRLCLAILVLIRFVRSQYLCRLSLFCYLLGLACFAAMPASLSARSQGEIVYAFRDPRSITPIKMTLVGEIKSKIKSAEIYDKDSPFKNYDTRLDQVTVRVVNREGIKRGQKLYVIDKNPHHEQYRNGLIVGEIVVESILKNPFYGLVLTGKGILLRVREGQFVARTLESENLAEALRIKKRGDALYARGLTAEAMAEYLKAIAFDRELADAHAALAYLYYLEAQKSGEYPVRSLSHYRQAFKYRQNFDTDLDRYRFLTRYLAALRLARNQTENKYANDSRPRIESGESVAAAEECMAMSEHPDCKIEAAQAYYELMAWYAGRSGAESRKNYDSYRDKAGLLLKQLSETTFGRTAETKDRIQYETGMGPFSKSSLNRSDFHRLSVLYYDLLSNDVDFASKPDARRRLVELVRENLTGYYQSRNSHLQPDPAIEAIRRRVEIVP